MAIRPHECKPGCYHGNQSISEAVSAYPPMEEDDTWRAKRLADKQGPDRSGYKPCGHPEYRNTSNGPQPNDDCC